jgi:hypothetical protein
VSKQWRMVVFEFFSLGNLSALCGSAVTLRGADRRDSEDAEVAQKLELTYYANPSRFRSQ